MSTKHPIVYVNDSDAEKDNHLPLLGIVAGVVALACILVALAPGAIFLLLLALEKPAVVIDETPNGSERGIRIESDGAWIYGPHGINVYQTGGWRKQAILSVSLANDGASLGPDNVQLVWQSNTQAILRLDGEEQEPDCHQITLGKDPEAVAIACSSAHL